MLTAAQVQRFHDEGFLVLPDFVPADKCLELRDRAMFLAEKLVPSPEEATIFTAEWLYRLVFRLVGLTLHTLHTVL